MAFSSAAVRLLPFIFPLAAYSKPAALSTGLKKPVNSIDARIISSARHRSGQFLQNVCRLPGVLRRVERQIANELGSDRCPRKTTQIDARRGERLAHLRSQARLVCSLNPHRVQAAGPQKTCDLGGLHSVRAFQGSDEHDALARSPGFPT